VSSYLTVMLCLTVYAVGITQYTQKGHIARATLEATCFQTKAILDAMEKDSGHTLSELAVDGGMSNSDLAMQVRRHTSSDSNGYSGICI
jgi:glycerol kinase